MDSKTEKDTPHTSMGRDIWAVEGIAHSILFFLDLPSFDALLTVFQAMPECLGYLQDAKLWTNLSKLHFGGPRDRELGIDDRVVRDRNWDWTSREQACIELQQFLQSSDDQASFNETVMVTAGDIETIENVNNTPLDGIAFPTGPSLTNPYTGAAGVVFRRAGRGLDKFVNSQSFRDGLPNGSQWLSSGSAITTPGFDAGVKTLIHCVGPSVGMVDCYELLARTYEEALHAVLREELQSVAVVSVSTGNLGVPCVKGAQVALRTIQKFIAKGNWRGKLAIVCNDEHVLKAFNNGKTAVLNDFNTVPPLPAVDSANRRFS